MDVHWSPRKRIKLTSDSSVPSRSTLVSMQRASNSPVAKPQSLKRISTDFDKELDELLDQPDPGFNPTQVFMEDPEMELAMLKADIDHAPPTSVRGGPRRSLSRWDTAPQGELANHPPPISSFPLEVKRHMSEPPTSVNMGLTQATTQLIDELEGIDINELTAAIDVAENVFKVSTPECTQCPPASSDIDMFSVRCRIEEIPIYSSDGLGVGMKVTEEATNRTRYITLQGVWLQAYLEDPWQVTVGDIVHVLAGQKSWEADHVIIGDSDTLFPDLIVFHPDSVISSTTLSASATCHRRSVIQNRVLAPSVGPPSEDPDDVARSLSPIIGNCVHEAVQAAAAVNDFSEKYILEAGEKALNEQMLSGVWSIGAVPSAVLSQLKIRLQSIAAWGQATWPNLASKLRGCETEIRPKSLGITGKLDMDIEDVGGARSCIEIKTGKPHAIHVGQVVLYYLLQYVDKHGNPNKELAASLPLDISQEYVLLYLPSAGAAESIKVKITAREAQNIMRNRNLVASHTVKKTLPNPIFKKGDCQFCPSRTECASHYIADGGTEKKFFDAVQYTRRNNIVFCAKEDVIDYQNKWIKWIDAQPTMEALGGLSAVRRMRGNLLHMSANALMKESGVHEGRDPAFYNWLPVLCGKAPSIGKVESLAGSLRKFNPKNRVGRVFKVASADSDYSRVVTEILVPCIQDNDRILLCGTSHEVIDNVLISLIASGEMNETLLKKVVRLASKPSDLPDQVRDRFMLPEDWMDRVAEIESSTQVFACTVKAVHHDILSRGDFNVAIVLDAHRVPDASLWAVFIRSRQAVLIGSGVNSSEEASENYLYQRIEPHVTWDKPVVVIDD